MSGGLESNLRALADCARREACSEVTATIRRALSADVVDLRPVLGSLARAQQAGVGGDALALAVARATNTAERRQRFEYALKGSINGRRWPPQRKGKRE